MGHTLENEGTLFQCFSAYSFDQSPPRLLFVTPRLGDKGNLKKYAESAPGWETNFTFSHVSRYSLRSLALGIRPVVLPLGLVVVARSTVVRLVVCSVVVVVVAVVVRVIAVFFVALLCPFGRLKSSMRVILLQSKAKTFSNLKKHTHKRSITNTYICMRSVNYLIEWLKTTLRNDLAALHEPYVNIWGVFYVCFILHSIYICSKVFNLNQQEHILRSIYMELYMEGKKSLRITWEIWQYEMLTDWCCCCHLVWV